MISNGVTLSHFDLDQILEKTIKLNTETFCQFIDNYGAIEACSNVYVDFLPDTGSIEIEYVIASDQGNVSNKFQHQIENGAIHNA